HGKVDLVPAHAQEAHGQGRRAGRDGSQEKPQGQGRPRALEPQPAGVGADGKVGGLAKGQKPRVAKEQVEGRGKQAQDQDFGQQEHVKLPQPQGKQGRRGHQGQPRPAVAIHRHAPPLPNSPRGRSTRMSAMARNMKAMFHSGITSRPKALSCPTSSDPRAAPPNPPRPPMTTTANAYSMLSSASGAEVPTMGPMRTPPRAVKKTPRVNTPVYTSGTLIPRDAAISRSSAHARMIRPGRVRAKNSHKSSPKAAATAMPNRYDTGYTTPKMSTTPARAGGSGRIL